MSDAARIVEQQPDWDGSADLSDIMSSLREKAPLVGFEDICRLRELLGEVAAGRRKFLQIGDCAEDPRSNSQMDTSARLDFYRAAAAAACDSETVVVGRIAGQLAKPRSSNTETVGGKVLPSYRGSIVNDPAPLPRPREHDPRRMLDAYTFSSQVIEQMMDDFSRGGDVVWTSHEALVLDYETSLLRYHEPTGNSYLASTHLPWVGKRTNRPDGRHIDLVRDIVNPVAIKLGTESDQGHVLKLLRKIDPAQIPGKVTFIIRRGAQYGGIESVMRAAHDDGYNPLWVCDPMHANTQTSAAGIKTRRLDDIKTELRLFHESCTAAGVQPAGIHLEATYLDVQECIDSGAAELKDGLQTTLCDPRLNRSQTLEIAGYWKELDYGGPST